MNTQVEQFFNSAPAGQNEIMEAVRNLLQENVSNLTEEFKWSRPVFSAAGKPFCYLQKNKNHVTLGFMNFEKLGEEVNCLEGTGSQMRHLKIKSIQDFDAQKLRMWFKILTE